jgi:hypothetical protein
LQQTYTQWLRTVAWASSSPYGATVCCVKRFPGDRIGLPFRATSAQTT